MAYTEYFDYTSGLILYAKAKPLDATWATGVIALTENASTGEYSASTFVDNISYNVYEQLGGSPASSDTKIGGISPSMAGAGLTDEQAAKIALIGTGTALVNTPVSGDGDLLELVLGTDYLAANGRALEWTFDEITGITTSAVGHFGIENAADGTKVYVNTAGIVTDIGYGIFQVAFDISNGALDALTPGNYDWSVEIVEGSTIITIARNRQAKTRVAVVENRTTWY